MKAPNRWGALGTNDTLAERLRRRPAKPMGSPRVGSNPTGVDILALFSVACLQTIESQKTGASDASSCHTCLSPRAAKVSHRPSLCCGLPDFFRGVDSGLTSASCVRRSPTFLRRCIDTLPEWSKGVDSSSTSASCVGSNPTGVISKTLNWRCT